MELRPNSKKFKILQLSNSVWTPSGYGVQSKGTLYEWNKHYDVRQLAFYGLEGARIEMNGLQMYPILPGDTHGDRTARLIFRNSPWKPDLFVTLYDIWMGAYVDEDLASPSGFKPIHPYWIPIVMVDHDPIPEATLIQAATAYRVVTPTAFGASEFKRANIDVWEIPFGGLTPRPVGLTMVQGQKRWIALTSDAVHLISLDGREHFEILLEALRASPHRRANRTTQTAK